MLCTCPCCVCAITLPQLSSRRTTIDVTEKRFPCECFAIRFSLILLSTVSCPSSDAMPRASSDRFSRFAGVENGRSQRRTTGKAATSGEASDACTQEFCRGKDDGMHIGGRLAVVELWASERGLDGFTLGSRERGADFRSDLLKADREGLANGHTGARPAAFWERVAQWLCTTGSSLPLSNAMALVISSAINRCSGILGNTKLDQEFRVNSRPNSIRTSTSGVISSTTNSPTAAPRTTLI